MKRFPVFLLSAFLMWLFSCTPAPIRAAAVLELYGTFHAMGIIATIEPTDDPNGNASASVEYRAGGELYHAGFPLSRIADTRFVGSLFWLEPGTDYDVRVTFSDPDGGPLDGVTVEASGASRSEITIPTANRSLIVSPSGIGSACTLASPCSLTEGLNQAQPGDEVLLLDGTYYQGEFDIPRSGTAGSPIVIRAFDGETAALDGADPQLFPWTHQGGGVYHATINTPAPHLVLSDGQRLFPYSSMDDLENLAWDNTPGFLDQGTDLYVHLAGNADPNTTTMTISRYNYAFYVEQDFIYFSDLTFQHYGQGSYPKTIYLNNASDNLVQHCTFASNDLGIGIKRDSNRNLIQENSFFDTIFDWPWDGIKTEEGLEDGGVAFYNPMTGRGNVIRRNLFHDDFDGMGVCPSNEAALSNETDVYENLIYNMGDDGMETDGVCSNVRIWGNTFHDVLMGISLAPVYDGPVYAIRNLIYRTGVGNNNYSGSPFKFNSGYGLSGPMYLFHNTGDAALAGNNGLYVKSPGTWESIYARNNIWAGTDYAIENYNTSQPIDLDYDDLWNGNSGDLARWDNVRYASLAAFSAATGQETHGASVDPDFADPVGDDYSLAPGSELIDAGVTIPGVNDNFAGAAPDIGALEYAGAGFSWNVTPAMRVIPPGGAARYTVAVQPVGGFSSTVNLLSTSPSPSLTLSLLPPTIDPPGESTLAVTHTQAGAAPLPGVWFTLPITAAGGGITQTTTVTLLVGGACTFLPLIQK